MLSGIISSVGAGASRFSGDSDDIIIGDSDTTFHASADNNIAIGIDALDSTSGEALRNIAIGTDALTALTTGDDNIGVGHKALEDLQGGHSNTSLGVSAGGDITSGIGNIAVGYNALLDSPSVSYAVIIGYSAGIGNMNSGADGTVAIGKFALTALTSGAGNIGIGKDAGSSITTSSDNTYIGHQAGDGNTGGQNVGIGSGALGDSSAAVTGATAIGYLALALADHGNDNYSIAIGHQALTAQSLSAATPNLAIGGSSGAAITTGAKNIAIGHQAMLVHTTGGNNTVIGYGAMVDTDNSGGSDDTQDSDHNTFIGSHVASGTWGAGKSEANTAIGSSTMTGDITTSNYNVAVGLNALNGDLSSVTGAVAIGAFALTALTQGASNVAIGYQAGTLITTGASNTILGDGAMDATPVAASSNVAIGKDAMGGAASGNTTSDYNVAIGQNVMVSGDLSGANQNVGIGYVALNVLSTGKVNVAIGKGAAKALTTAERTVIIGAGAAEDGTMITNGGGSVPSYADGTVGIGYEAVKALTTGAGNIAIGYQAADALTVGDDNLAIGYQAMSALSTTDGSDKNIAIGNSALGGAAGGGAVNENVFIGYSSGGGGWTSNASAYNVGIGNYTMTGAMNNGNNNVAVGWNAGGAVTSGDSNICIGRSAGVAINIGNENVCIGGYAGAAIADADECVLIGYQAGTTLNHSTDADGTVAVGWNALAALTSGARNTAVGYNTLLEETDGNDNTVIGYEAMDDSGALTNLANTFIGSRSGSGTWANNPSNYNVGVGAYTLDAAMDGALGNTAVGYAAASALTTGDANVCIGKDSAASLTTGGHGVEGNVIIGATADCAAASTNRIAIGYGCTAVGTDNTVTLGNASVTDVYMAQDSGAAIHCAKVNSSTATGTPAGGGFDGAEACDISVSHYNSEIVTTIYVDLGQGGATNISSIATDHAVIGEGATAAAYLTRLTQAVNGLVYKGEYICLEAPAGGDDSVNLASNSASLAAQADVDDANGQVLADSALGVAVANLGEHIVCTFPNSGIDNDYIYLSAGTGDVAADYTAGKFLIRFWGASVTGL